MSVENSAYSVGEQKNTAVSSQRKAALISGLGILLMMVPAIFANFIVLQSMVMEGDAAATTANAAADQTQLLLAILSLGLVAILDVIVGWTLYISFKPVNRTLSMAMGSLRIIYGIVFGIAIVNLVRVLTLLGGAGSPVPAQLQEQVYASCNAFTSVWQFALIIFGVHLLLLGMLTFQTSLFSKILGILVVISGLGYVIDGIVFFLAPELNIAIGQFTFFGELLLAIWLVVKGLNGKTWREPVPVSAS